MPARLRPSAPIAADAILVGDPGRAMLLAQELLERPKMSNHARGLWGYGGTTATGLPLNVQATGMGGPSAAIVLADLAELGVERAVRVGTCAAARPGSAQIGELLTVERTVALGDPGGAPPSTADRKSVPDPTLSAALDAALGAGARPAPVASLDSLGPDPATLPADVVATDLQTAALLARGAQLGLGLAAVLVVVEATTETLAEERLEDSVKEAGRAALAALAQLRSVST